MNPWVAAVLGYGVGLLTAAIWMFIRGGQDVHDHERRRAQGRKNGGGRW